MDAKTLSNLIVSDINKRTFLSKITCSYNHIDIHSDKSKAETLDRVLSGNKSANSAFYSEDDMRMYIEDNLLYSARNIAKWLESAGYHEKKQFLVECPRDYYEHPVGTGYMRDKKNNSIREYTSDTVCVVLQQETNSRYGFNVITAYPDMVHTTAIFPTNEDLTNIIKQTQTYKSASPVKKAYIEYITDTKNSMCCTHRTGQYELDERVMLHIPFENNTKMIVSIGENSMSTYTVDLSTRKKIPTELTELRNDILTKNGEKLSKKLYVNLLDKNIREEFKKKYPKIYDAANDIHMTIRKYADMVSNKDLKNERIHKAEKLTRNIKNDYENDIHFNF